MKNPYYPIPVKIDKIRFETEDKLIKTFDLVFLEEKDDKEFTYYPGQFAELSILGKGESPIGIASSPTEKGFLRFTVMKVGVVTRALHNFDEGALMGIRGPLGNWYPIKDMRGSNVVIIGGGFAFTTLRSLLIYMLDEKHRKDYGNITCIYGARTPGLLCYRDELKEWEKRKDMSLYQCIDWKFGSEGPIQKEAAEGWEPVNLKEPGKTKIEKGKNRFTAFVPQMVQAAKPESKDTYAIVCGPPIMIKFTIPVLAELGFPPEKIYNSLEMRMKCGIGKCGRCNIGPKYVCKDGPVFSLRELQELPGEY
jgi:sulfhydrogenase subunit gamma (sulfur reductase)